MNKSPDEKIEAALKKEIAREIKEKRDDDIYTSFLETDDFILEQINPIIENSATVATHTNTLADTKFLFYRKQTGSIDYLTEYTHQGKTIYPIIDDLLKKNVVLLPSGIGEYGETEDLIAEIREFLIRNFEVDTFYSEFLPYMVLFYWVYDRFPFVPYIHFVGLTGTGKTTAQEVFGSICYKPIDASGSITLSPIFRMSSQWRGTLLLDEFEPNGDGYQEMLAFLKSGVSNKAVLRTEGDKKREVMAYMIKSPKIFTSEQPINNAGLRSRMFVIEMNKNKRRVPLYRLQSFEQESLKIRNKLLLWRLRHLDKIDLRQIEYGYPELSGFDGRVQQIITPIYYLSDTKTQEKILEFAKLQESETKLERLDSLEGQIFQTICDVLPEDITVKAVYDKINTDRARKPTSEKRIANIIRKILHFSIERVGHENVSTVITIGKEDRILELKEYFGISPSERVASVASVASDGLDYSDDPLFATHSATHSDETPDVSQNNDL